MGLIGYCIGVIVGFVVGLGFAKLRFFLAALASRPGG